MRVLLIGKSSGRLDCLAEAIARSKQTELFILTNLVHPGLTQKGFVTVGPTDNPGFVTSYAETHAHGASTIALISNEEPLAAGVVDALDAVGIPTVGPTKSLARIEASKSFTRHLLANHNLAHMNPNWGSFEPGELSRVEAYMWGFRDFVIKPDGLTGGKGVRVKGDHFHTVEEGLEYCRELFAAGSSLLIEQKQEGQEFSLMSFSDGETIVEMPAVQDHKRLLDLDMGPNTGGMGSYSDINHSLPILSISDFRNAQNTNHQVIQALQKETGQPYRGILYGNYMVTKHGLKVIEFNARFGDPEVMNVLPILKSDFGDILFAITRGTLTRQQVQFHCKATVCKYLVPIGHPDNPQDGTLDLSRVPHTKKTRVYRGALDGDKLTGSRAAAIVGIGDTIIEAEKLAEDAVQKAIGPVFHRKDIGTYEALARRIEHADRVRRWR